MEAEGLERLLKEISEFCTMAKIAESTFGRLAVNDGKFVSRLRTGGKLGDKTVDRVRNYIANYATTKSTAVKGAEHSGEDNPG